MADIIAPAALVALQTTITDEFTSVMTDTPVWSTPLFTKMRSTTLMNTYAWLADLPAMREWIGARHVIGLRERLFQILNKDYELTVGVSRNSILDQTVSSEEWMRKQIMYQAARLPDDLIVALLRNGHLATATGYDGQNFFDTDHPTDIANVTGTQSNYSASGMAFNAANYQTVRQTMLGYVGEGGRARNTAGARFLLVVPPQLEMAARTVLNAEIINTVYGSNTAAAAQTNILRNSAELLVVPDLAVDATTWYLFRVDAALRPFILQERQAPQLTALFNADDPNVFWRKEFIMGIDARMGAGYGPWFLAYKAVA